MIDANILEQIFKKCWSIDSSSKWTKENPANGQCGVTSLVLHDLYGGDIVKTWTNDGWHFYLYINGDRIELTKSQFREPIDYRDNPSSREEAFLDTNMEQYRYLKNAILAAR
ncbi:YunG family protein [Metabacillus sp. HB246100]